MAKKNWIYIKRGLSHDPKHRAQMGECIWLYLHIIDRADWETGTAYDWKDEQEAAEMAMSLPTLRHQRRKLDELGYITTKQRKRGQDIVIMKWTNPRAYSGETINQPAVMNSEDSESDNPLTPNEIKGDNKGYNKGDNKGDSQVNTTTSNSESKSESTPAFDIFKSWNEIMGIALTQWTGQELQEIEKQYPPDWITEAFRIAAGNNARNLKYVKGCLTKMEAKGRDWKPGADAKKTTTSKPKSSTE